MGCLRRKAKLSELALCSKCHDDPKVRKIHEDAPKISDDPTEEELDMLIGYMSRPEHLPDWYLRDVDLYNRGDATRGLEFLIRRGRV